MFDCSAGCPCAVLLFFFFKQKTAYEIYQCDWSSDVCSSDLCGSVPAMYNWPGQDLDGVGNFVTWQNLQWLQEKSKTAKKAVIIGGGLIGIEKIGRASCRERV